MGEVTKAGGQQMFLAPLPALLDTLLLLQACGQARPLSPQVRICDTIR